MSIAGVNPCAILLFVVVGWMLGKATSPLTLMLVDWIRERSDKRR
jgi:hypothetical protein